MPRPPAPEVRPVAKGPSSGLIAGVVVLVVALIGALVFWAATRDQDLQAAGTSSALPEGGGVRFGPAEGTDVPEVHLYADPQCPWCGVLERQVGSALAERAQAGDLALTVTLMSFLDGEIGGEHSARAAGAALCADDADAFLPFVGAMYAQQPQEGVGWTDEQLVALGGTAGISGADRDTFASCVAERPHQDYVEAMQQRANRDGVSGTPRLFVNGEEISEQEMRGLMQDGSTLDSVLAAHAGGTGR